METKTAIISKFKEKSEENFQVSLINLHAINLLESLGVYRPTERCIELTENFLLHLLRVHNEPIEFKI